ncbi:MAG: TAXI family TRAP transporter solute-binding subunit, partial [Candidatus Electrothrix sp. AUS1_2]|nr:TAXI family TRAP transporter solute-binding subunit [Candidatus Electrothrix sp. AUS1_2]
MLIGLVLLIISGGAIGTWFCARNALSDAIRIAGGPKGGEYYKFGEAVKERLQSGKGRRVQNIQTGGTLENLALLQQGKVDFAFLQSIVFPSRNISVVAPLYLEPVIIPARKESGIESVYDLANKRVCTGSGQSGTGKTADTLLEFYGLKVEKVPAFFTVDHDDCDAGIIVMGLRSPSLKKIGTTGAVRFLDLPYTQALTESEAYTAEFSIPEAMFARDPSLPGQTLHTFAYTALLAVNSDKASAEYINEVLEIIYQTDIRTKFPDL